MPAFPDSVMKNATIALPPTLLQRQTLSQLVDVTARSEIAADIAGGIARRFALVAGRDLFLRHATTTKI
jgi:hypothetical protein